MFPHVSTGRHDVYKIDRNERTCTLCPKEIDDEFHFWMNCKIYQNKFSEHDKLMYLFTGEKLNF